MTFLLNVKICSSKLDALHEAKHTEGLDADCDKFCAEGNCLYEGCIEYQEMDGANERIFLLHVDSTERYTTVEYCRTFFEVSD
jgi:hypothetical protein